MSIFGEPTPRERLRWRLQDQIRRLAVEEFDGDEVAVPLGDSGLTRPGLGDPLAGVRAAVCTRDVARGFAHDCAREARAVGRSWDEVGEAMGVVADDDDRSRAELAYDEIAERVDSFGGRRLSWRCTACAAWVADIGPYSSSHPDDNETGHAPGCARHEAAIAAWQARTGWEDQ